MSQLRGQKCSNGLHRDSYGVNEKNFRFSGHLEKRQLAPEGRLGVQTHRGPWSQGHLHRQKIQLSRAGDHVQLHPIRQPEQLMTLDTWEKTRPPNSSNLALPGKTHHNLPLLSTSFQVKQLQKLPSSFCAQAQMLFAGRQLEAPCR